MVNIINFTISKQELERNLFNSTGVKFKKEQLEHIAHEIEKHLSNEYSFIVGEFNEEGSL